MKKTIIALSVLVLLILALNAPDAINEYIVEKSIEESTDYAVSYCESLGLTDIDISVRKNPDKFKALIATINANGGIDAENQNLINTIHDIECIGIDCDVIGSYEAPIFLEFEYFFNGEEYVYDDNTLYHNGKAIQFRTLEAQVNNKYSEKEPENGMPECAMEYVKNSYSYEELYSPHRYEYDKGDTVITVYISDYEKDFGLDSDYFVTRVTKIKKNVPYAGMKESDIGTTSLGKPSGNIRHNYYTERGKTYRTNIYDFCSGGLVIFSVRCVNGRVKEVWDYRDNPHKPYGSYGGGNTSDDPYNAKDYAHAEDFYYDYYDDFFDYEEAEEYYNKHSQ